MYNSRKRNLELEKLGLEVKEMKDPGATGGIPFSELSWRDKARRNGEVVAAMVRDQSGKMVLMKKVDGKSTYLSSLRSKGLYYVRIYIENENALPTLVTKEMIIK